MPDAFRPLKKVPDSFPLPKEVADSFPPPKKVPDSYPPLKEAPFDQYTVAQTAAKNTNNAASVSPSLPTTPSTYSTSPSRAPSKKIMSMVSSESSAAYINPTTTGVYPLANVPTNYNPSTQPSKKLTDDPSSKPYIIPSTMLSQKPSEKPNQNPYIKPSVKPSTGPSQWPSTEPSQKPSMKPFSTQIIKSSQKPTSRSDQKSSMMISATPSFKPCLSSNSTVALTSPPLLPPVLKKDSYSHPLITAKNSNEMLFVHREPSNTTATIINTTLPPHAILDGIPYVTTTASLLNTTLANTEDKVPCINATEPCTFVESSASTEKPSVEAR